MRAGVSKRGHPDRNRPPGGRRKRSATGARCIRIELHTAHDELPVLARTPHGRAFVAVRDCDFSAEILGLNLLRTKLSALERGATCARSVRSVW